ncbi:MAG TPA: GxxExxY protein [Phycisphaerae bacterium]|nr:GxxExxY protein [Phycisphaerae bacterium]
MKQDVPHGPLTGRIIRAAFDVSNALGCGFLEKVYERALTVELQGAGLKVDTQVPLHVVYRGQTVGEYVADMIVDGAVLVEVKATTEDQPVYVAQVLNYLKATRLPVGLLLNFGRPRLGYRRLILNNQTAAAREESAS